jgi:signal transduction histidine kinase
VRLRLIVGSILLTAAATIAFFIPAAIALANAEREAQVVELQQEAADAATAAEAGALRPGLGTDDPLRAAKARGEAEHDYALYDPAGARTDGDGPAVLEALLRPALAGHSRSGRTGGLRIAAVPLASGGALRASEPANEADERVRSALLRLGGQGLGLVLVASAAAWLVARRLTRPLADLGAAATRLGGGDFTVRAPLAGMPEVDEVATALNATAQRLGTSVDRLRRLGSDASHQLRTPLAGLRASLEAELLQPRADPTDARGEALGAVERLEQTVVSLTELARDEVAPDALPAAEVLAAALERWSGPVAASGRALRIAAGPAILVRARRPAVDAILDVLVDNALRHGAGTITLEAGLGVGGAALRVADQGTFTAPEGAVFDAEATERNTGRRGRPGIGLGLARTLAEAEGGRLRLVGDGPTTFELQLPTGDAGQRGRRAAPPAGA